jgi:RHS repeat-associated protein
VPGTHAEDFWITAQRPLDGWNRPVVSPPRKSPRGHGPDPARLTDQRRDGIRPRATDVAGCGEQMYGGGTDGGWSVECGADARGKRDGGRTPHPHDRSHLGELPVVRCPSCFNDRDPGQGNPGFDPDGKTLATAGAAADLGYQGGWTDPTTSFVNAASRWYNPGTGTFTSADTQQNEPAPAVDANPYAYGNDDPLDNSDPSGHDACTAQLAAKALAKAVEAKADARVAEIKKANAKAAAERKEREEEAREAEQQRERAHHRQHSPSGSGDRGNCGGRSSAGNGATGTWSSDQVQRHAYDLYDSRTGNISGSSSEGTKKKHKHWYQNGWVIGGATAVVVVGVLILVPAAAPAVVTGALAADYELAGSASISCAPGNAPAKPKNAVARRITGPSKATGPAGSAEQVGRDLPPSTTGPTEAPIQDTVTNAPQDLPAPDDCFQGAYKRTDGTRTAAIWQCGTDESSDGVDPRSINFRRARSRRTTT